MVILVFLPILFDYQLLRRLRQSAVVVFSHQYFAYLMDWTLSAKYLNQDFLFQITYITYMNLMKKITY